MTRIFFLYQSGRVDEGVSRHFVGLRQALFNPISLRFTMSMTKFSSSKRACCNVDVVSRETMLKQRRERIYRRRICRNRESLRIVEVNARFADIE